ncbi:MAG: 50S ribosomal protein L30 [Phycisphaeraceae bacterium]|nr:50S ribosomal protein L30 [Phycisphaeraceae bacterium]
MAKKGKTLKIKYVRSSIGRPKSQKKMIKGLGFRRLNQVVERPDTPAIRGMINQVSHLVEVVEGEES